MRIFNIKRLKLGLLNLLFVSSLSVAQGTPVYYDFNNMPAHELIPTISMRFVNSDKFTVIQWNLKSGAKLYPQHKHVNEQVIRILAGDIDAYSGDNIYHLHTGDVMIFPANVSHGFIAITDSIMYETQTPVREDFLTLSFIEKLSDLLKNNQ
ncbi:MAG: cupin domain-containing protein [Gammaproteobacteria bacterium]|nr:cupin domain-containing protein [Gammaproteobacteria bacterium]MCW5584150.1 cupin domain-containing protein [Gammaproteobacteria bacterium]